MNDPKYAVRLVMAMVLALSLGSTVLKRGWRPYLKSRRRRSLSIF